MIIVLGGIKGGCGKTTLATNLAVISSAEKKRVLLVDADEQRSASDWSDHRESLNHLTPWTTIQLVGSAVRTETLKMKDNYDQIIIDTGGRDTTSQRAALTIADVFVAPFQPKSFDVWTLEKVFSLLEEIRSVNPKLIAYAVINRGDINGTDNLSASEIIKEMPGIKVMPVFICQRKSFSNASSQGLGVTEMKVKDKKAIEEITQFSSIIFNTGNIPD